MYLLGKATPLSIDYKYKTKTDDYTQADFNPIKHVKIAHFMMHLSLVGLAAAWKVASTWPIFHCPTGIYQAIGLFSAVWFIVWVVLYMFKMVLYPQKVRLSPSAQLGCSPGVPFLILFPATWSIMSGPGCIQEGATPCTRRAEHHCAHTFGVWQGCFMCVRPRLLFAPTFSVGGGASCVCDHTCHLHPPLLSGNRWLPDPAEDQQCLLQANRWHLHPHR